MKALVFLTCLSMAALGCASTDSDDGSMESGARTSDVRAFVRQTFIHGVPYEEASRYSTQDVPALLEMLADPSEEAYWANIVVTLCMIGDARCVEPLIAFVTADHGKLSRSSYAAKTSAIMSLGYVVHANGDKRALAFLQEACDPTSWKRRGIRWSDPDAPPMADRDAELSTLAILGLSLAGTPEARAALQRLADSQDQVPLYRSAEGLIQQAIETNARIERQGLKQYYVETKH